ncbi:MAG: hypothetical protein IKJ78_05595 [Bacteroidales bacterium]|nr:hypothetical protein [Bacteroidales bacterium]
MKKNNKMKSIYNKLLLVSLLMVTFTGTVTARECTECKKTNLRNASVQTKAAVCKRAQSTAELNINNVRTQINGYGNMWYDGSIAKYFVPKSGNASPLYCAALWIGGTDVNDQLRLAALRFGQNGDDYWPGPIKVNGTASTDLPVCNAYDKHWIITKAEVMALKSHFSYDTGNRVTLINPEHLQEDITDVIANWPAKGDGDDLTDFLAPFYDADGDLEYNPASGDYPYYDFDNKLCPRTLKAEWGDAYIDHVTPTMEDDAGIVSGGLLSDQVLKGDQTIWWVFNDMGNTHTESGGLPIGIEIRAQAFAFATNDEINNMTFYSYEIINRSTYELRETYFSQWVDPDLGNARDDYVGCDVRRGLGYCYNGTKTDLAGAGSYSGIPPAVGIDFFQGPYMDPDGKDNPKINIPWILASGSDALKQRLSRYLRADGTYDTIAITDDADGFFNAADDGYKSWYFVPGDEVGNCAINGVNFGNNIVDDERFGMRRFVYYLNSGSGRNAEPSKAVDYYNYLRGYWRDNTRMTFGNMGLDGSVTCDFMFPGDSDPWLWGTNGVNPGNDIKDHWTEYEMPNNPPDDRRFMQSAGPFTLKPGALNYITVGIPWAQAASGDQWSSVELLRQVDDVCQALFENCFKVLDGPDAPTLTAQELNNEIILYVSYENPESNNYGERYNEEDPSIMKSYSVVTSRDTTINGVTYTTTTTTSKDYTDDQRSYKFEGYQIFQLVDANASIADIRDYSKARQVAQCDIENYYDSTGDRNQAISKLVNYDIIDGIVVGNVMVNGTNSGIQHAFRITRDMFATGTNTSLVNNREYYYIAVAYAQNRYKEYSQTEATKLDGQMTPYLAGRMNEWGGSIAPITVIPHNPVSEAGGKIPQSEFGMCPSITRLEGYGNGGYTLRLTDASINSLMGAYGVAGVAPGEFVDSVAANGMADFSYMKNPCIIVNPQYQENYGPINVRVIDPLKVKAGQYNVCFWNGSFDTTVTPNVFVPTLADTVKGVVNNTRWCIVRADGSGIPVHSNGNTVLVDTVWSDFSIGRYNEQLFLELGFAVSLKNPVPAATDLSDSTKIGPRTYNTFYNGFVNDGAMLSSEMFFSDERLQWLSGIADNDNSTLTNWIRSGAQHSNSPSIFGGTSGEVSLSEPYLDDDYYKEYYDSASARMHTVSMDKGEVFEDVVSGLWSPYALVSTMPYHPGFNFSHYMPSQELIDSMQALTSGNPGYAEFRPNRIIRYKRDLMRNDKNQALNYSDMSQLPSVHIVLTADTSKWTRCPVIEMCDDYTQAEGNARKFSARAHKSVDKNGDTLVGNTPASAAQLADPNSPAYISEYGMGWFPGYAINTVTGERLNIMFGEDSRYVQFNGRDMIWNPVSNIVDGTQDYVLGGRHFIYVLNAGNIPFHNMKEAKAQLFKIKRYHTPSYDAGRWARKMLASVDNLMSFVDTAAGSGMPLLWKGIISGEDLGNPLRDSIAMLYSSVAWVNMPLVNSRYAFKHPGRSAMNDGYASNGIPTDVTINIDIRTPYGRFMGPNGTTYSNCGRPNLNGNMPAYQFTLSSSDAVLENLAINSDDKKAYADSLLNLISVVPNPYYSYSNYETSSQLETKVRIINLPTGEENGVKVGCTINIYTVDGTLVRTIGPTAVIRDNDLGAEATTVDWDLHNHTGIPIAGGMYLIHVSVPGIGEKVIKWFGTMRPVDLNSYQF